MPHIILEYSSNVVEPDFSRLFKECHELLTGKLPTEMKNCKSRAIKCVNYYVGDGNADNGFVHVTLKIMPGRERERLEGVGLGLLALLKKHFSESSKQLNLEFSVEINELTLPYTKG